MKSRIKVRIGSLNDAKIEAVRRGLEAFYEDVEVAATRIPSGVSEQPIGFSEILAGARARALGSFAMGDCELAAGIEDGLIPVEGVATGPPSPDASRPIVADRRAAYAASTTGTPHLASSLG